MKKSFSFMIKSTLILTLVMTLAACATDGGEDIAEALPQQKTFDSFAEVYNNTVPTLFEIKARKTLPRRVSSGNGTQTDSLSTVYLVPDSSAINTKGKYTGTQAPIPDPISLSELVELADVNSWTFAMNNDGTAIDSVKMSEAEAREKLHPMVLESIKYLKSKGLNNAQIHEMLTSCHADSTQLVPLVLAMKEVEDDVAAQTNMQLSAPSTGKQQPTQSTKINWEKVGGCVFKALGFDVGELIISAFTSSKVAVWTYSLILQTFKVVAKEFVGPLNIAIVVIHFAVCMGKS